MYSGLIAAGNLFAAFSHLVDSFSFLNFFQLNRLQNSHGSLLGLIFSNYRYPNVKFATFQMPALIHIILMLLIPTIILDQVTMIQCLIS